MKLSKAFWEGFWFGLNPLNCLRVMRNLWCDWTHGGGYILRDPSGRVNWQCKKCGRWAQPVSEGDEANLLRAHMEKK